MPLYIPYTRSSRCLLVSHDPCVRFLADCNLQPELHISHKKFRPAEVAREALIISPMQRQYRKTLVKMAKGMVKDEDNTSIPESLHSLKRQGQMSWCTSPQRSSAWSTAIA